MKKINQDIKLYFLSSCAISYLGEQMENLSVSHQTICLPKVDRATLLVADRNPKSNYAYINKWVQDTNLLKQNTQNVYRKRLRTGVEVLLLPPHQCYHFTDLKEADNILCNRATYIKNSENNVLKLTERIPMFTLVQIFVRTLMWT